jgi:stress-induced morphogen
MTDAAPTGPVARRIHEKLLAAFAPSHLDVINESHMHSVPKGSETHFKVVVVSEQFDGKPLLQRHRMVNAALQNELDTGVHALSILSKTPTQWEGNTTVKPSPNCRGGMLVDEAKKDFLEGLKNKDAQ